MKSLRLLVTNDCNRHCDGCCNKQYKDIPIVSRADLGDWVNNYNELIITGGEPMLYPDKLRKLLKQIDNIFIGNDVILYTAKFPKSNIEALQVFEYLTGLTFTVHDNEGIKDFKRYNELINLYRGTFTYLETLRVNWFCDVKLIPMNLYGWGVKFIEWIPNCPLPQNEVFRKLNPLL